ncbi:MAG: DUF2283 domain-containing protein [Solirubrobacteraceae bacterium]
MPITAEYDREADALYVQLADGARVHAIEIDDATYIDVDSDGRAVGLELLYPSIGMNLRPLVDRLALDSQLAEILQAITASGAPIAPQTMTGGQHLASTTMLYSALEGSVAATLATPGATESAHSGLLVQTAG